MRKAAIISALMHVAVMVIAWFGLPNLFNPTPPEDKPLIVEVLPIAAITNAPPPKPEPPKVAEVKPEPPKPEPPKPEPPKPEPPKPPEPKPTPPPPPPPAPPPPAPAPPAPPAPAPKAEAPLPLPPKPRPEPPKPVQQAQQQQAPKQQKQQFNLDEMLRDLTKRKPQPAAAPQPAPQQTAQVAPRAASNAPHNPLIPLSMSEEDAIRQKIYQNWNVDLGAKGIETFIVDLRLFVGADGIVRDVSVENQNWNSDGAYRAFVESARRAVLKSSPLPIPADKAGQLTNGNLVLRFSAKDMLGLRG